MLICENVTISVGSHPIISNLNFTLLSNNCLVIKGKNGSGKSTLLKAIAGFISLSSGQILWHNKDIAEDLELYQSTQIAYLGHNFGLKGFLTVRENLSFFATCKFTQDIITASLKQFGISDLIDQPLYKLSQGTIKKVALARVILSNSRLWLLDEPDNNLDDFGKEMLAKLIDIRTKEGGCVIITSHDAYIDKNFPVINLEDYSK